MIRSRVWLAVAAVALVLLGLRFTAYEPLGTSISTYDTPEFIEAGHIAFPSTDFFLSGRPATISLMYKVLEPASGYRVTAFSSPAEDIFDPPAIQPGLERVAIAQGLISVGAWIWLAFVTARRLRNPGLQVLAVFVILAFGFSPTIAEWDAVLLSEPLALSLFVILLGTSIELVSRLAQSPDPSRGTKILAGLWFVILLLWIFSRDTNGYLLLVFVFAVAVFLIWRGRKKAVGLLSTRNLIIVLVLLGSLFFVQNLALQESGRWVNPFFNNMLHRVFPYPEHVAFFESKGMPITDEVWALRTSPGNEDAFFEIPELMAWTTEQGTGTYMQFLLAFPGWTFERFFSGVETSFSENRQPFFFPNEERTTPLLSFAGDLFHPRSSSVIWVVLVELAAFGLVSFRRRHAQGMWLFTLFCALFLGEILMLFISIHGDALGIVRHAMGSVMPLRLSVWLLPPLILDVYGSPQAAAPAGKASRGGKSRHKARQPGRW